MGRLRDEIRKIEGHLKESVELKDRRDPMALTRNLSV